MRTTALRTVGIAGAATLALCGTAAAATEPQVTVNGTGSATVQAGASEAQQRTAYEQALTAAIADAQSKARFVAGELTLTLGSVDGFIEESDDDIGYCGLSLVGPVEAGALAPAASTSGRSSSVTPIPAKRRHRKTRRAHKASSGGAETCQLQADVTIVYAAS